MSSENYFFNREHTYCEGVEVRKGMEIDGEGKVDCVENCDNKETQYDLEVELCRHQDLVWCTWTKFQELSPILTARG